MNRVLAVILGGGRGTRLFPLTLMRSKPAVPIGGKYRLVDVSISNCLHADIRRIYVLTQFNSASLNRHVAETYRLDMFSRGFVEILAAEQTPDNPNWYQGTADAVRQAARHFDRHDADYYLILSGDHLYRMDYRDMIEEHIERGSDITVAAQQVSTEDAPSMGIFRFDRSGQIVGFDEKPSPARLAEIGSSAPAGSRFLAQAPDKPFVASMGIYLFSREVLLETLNQHAGVDFGHEIIPAALQARVVNAYLFRGFWADVGTIASFYDTNIMLTRPRAPFNFYDPRRPVFTRPRFLPGSRFNACTINEAIVAEGCYLDHARIEHSVVGIRSHIYRGCQITRSVLLGADFYEADDEAPAKDGGPALGIGRDAVLDRVIVDKNARVGEGARLTNDAGVQHADGDGYYIRNGIIIVPRGGTIRPGTVV
ncbi:MAG: glucose-1-phosphate adenylyltransferase [Acidobacteria bacterium]|nr:glucose-1-phosphate adenylyltransferase [Acidobacteriota bacterium]